MASSTKPTAKTVQPEVMEAVPVSSGSVRLKPDERGHYVAEFRMNGRPVEAWSIRARAWLRSTNRPRGGSASMSRPPTSSMRSTLPTARQGCLRHDPEIEIGRVRVRDVKRQCWMTGRSTGRFSHVVPEAAGKLFGCRWRLDPEAIVLGYPPYHRIPMLRLRPDRL